MKKLPSPASVRGVNYATSPLLASKTPNWRSRFIVGGGANVLAVRAARGRQKVSTGNSP